MYKAYARHHGAKGSPDAWFAVFAGFTENGEEYARDKGYEKLLEWRGDLDADTVRERYDISVLTTECETEVWDPALKRQIPCGVFSIFCPTCEYALEVTE